MYVLRWAVVRRHVKHRLLRIAQIVECLTIAREDRCKTYVQLHACMLMLQTIAELHAACMALTSLVCRWIECQTDVAPIQTTCLHLQLSPCLLVKEGKSEIHFPSSDLKVVKGKLNSLPSRHDTITENITGAIFYILPTKKIALVIFFSGAAF